MDDDEIMEISQTMASLGKVSANVVERLFIDFAEQMTSTNALVGTLDSTERLLIKVLGKDKVGQIMEEIRGPAGRNMWEKLGNVNEEILANFLQKEYPQTVAVVMSKVSTEHAARVLALLPENFALEVVHRMLRMEAVQKALKEAEAKQPADARTLDDVRAQAYVAEFGQQGSNSRQWMFRGRDEPATRIEAERNRLEDERAVLARKSKELRDQNPPNEVEARQVDKQIEAIAKDIKAVQGRIQERTNEFRKALNAAFPGAIAADGEEILAAGGSLSHHHGVGKIRSEFLRDIYSEGSLQVGRDIKAAIDPENLFGAAL